HRPLSGGGGRRGEPQTRVRDEWGERLAEFAKPVARLIDEGNVSGQVTGLVTALRVNVPQFAIEVDRTKAKTLGLSLSDVFRTFQAYLGGYYVNDFNRFGRVFRVFVQAEPDNRARPE